MSRKYVEIKMIGGMQYFKQYRQRKNSKNFR